MFMYVYIIAVHVEPVLLTSTTTPSTPSTESSKISSEVAHPDTFGCMIENAFYPDGAQVL